MKFTPLLALLMVGCAANTPVGKAVVKTVTFTTEDLTNAEAISKANGDLDHGVECYGWLISEQPAIQAALAPPASAPVSGVFSTLESTNVGVNTVQTGISPALKSAFEANCGPYIANIAGGINFLMLKAGETAL